MVTASPQASVSPSTDAAPAPPPSSTEPEEPSRSWIRFDEGLRYVAYALVFGVVVAAMFGLAGLRTRELVATNDDLTLTVTYAQITRPGIATPFEIAIDAHGSATLPAELSVDVPTGYLAMFDENGLAPEPDAATSDGTTETWTFRPGDASTLVIDFDARLQPNIHSGRSATVRVSGLGAEPVAVHLRTWVLP